MKLTGIRKVCSDSKHLGANCYLQVNVDLTTGEVWSNYHCSIGQNWWTNYASEDIINCGNISRPTKMQEIRQMVEDAIRFNKMCKEDM